MDFTASVLQGVNNETVLLADTMDNSGTNDRAEWLPLAPWATIAVPEGIPVEVRIVPTSPEVSSFTVGLEEICRDVIRYSSPLDLLGQLIEGQFYVVFPDPLHRGCEDVSRYAYHPPGRVTPVGEEGPSSATPADQWWFAFVQARIKSDLFTHWTSLMFDEAGNIFDPDAQKDEHDEYQKVRTSRRDFADARKKGVSVYSYSHALSEVSHFFRAKQRWWITMNGMTPPIGQDAARRQDVPNPDESLHARHGQGRGDGLERLELRLDQLAEHQARGPLDAEVSIDFDFEAVGL